MPDGFLSPQTFVPAYAAVAAAAAVALRRIRSTFREETLPRLAVLTAFAFVLMSLALPLPGGTSVHASGVALVAINFGPSISFVAVSGVLLLQALLFGAGGITSLPVNALALGLGGSLVAVAAYRTIRPLQRDVALFAAGWLSVVVAAALMALVLGVQPLVARAADGSPLFFPFPLSVTLPAIVVPHALVGVGEGVLTVLTQRLLDRIGGGAGP